MFPITHPRMSGPRILIVEDDKQVSSMLSLCLQREGYRVIEAHDGAIGLELALSERPDLLVLDLELPKLGGLEICRELRRLKFGSPILMLTGRDVVDDRVAGLDAGADDYLAKPFVPRELVARLRALLRRNERNTAITQVLQWGLVRVDLAQRKATHDNEPLPLTKTEYALLELLVSSRGAVVSRDTILDVVWGYTRFPTTRTVDTHIWRLRKKLGDVTEPYNWIAGVTGVGYRLGPVWDASQQTFRDSQSA